MRMTVEALAQRISRIDDIKPEFATMIATGLLPFIERHIAAGQRGAMSAWVGDMKTSAGMDYYVCVGHGEEYGEYMTPNVYKIRGRAEHDVARWNHLFGLCDAPDILAFDTDEPTATPQPPKPAGAMPLAELVLQALVASGCVKQHKVDEAREIMRPFAAGRADAVPEGYVLVPHRDLTDADIDAFADHFGWCDEDKVHPEEREEVRRQWQAFVGIMAAPQQMTTQGEAVDPWATLIALCEALDIDPETARSAPGKPSDVILEAARKKFTGSQP